MCAVRAMRVLRLMSISRTPPEGHRVIARPLAREFYVRDVNPLLSKFHDQHPQQLHLAHSG